MRKFFNRFAKKPAILKNDFRVNDITWHLATYARRGEVYEKSVSDGKGNKADYRVDYFSDGQNFTFEMNITKDGKSTQTSLTAAKGAPYRMVVSSFVFEGVKEPMKSKQESFNALNFIVNQIRAIELSGKVPELHKGTAVPFNKLSRFFIRRIK